MQRVDVPPLLFRLEKKEALIRPEATFIHVTCGDPTQAV